MSARAKGEFGGEDLKCLWIRAIAPFILLTLAAPLGATTLNSYARTREGLSNFAKKSYYPAYQDFMKALDDDPLNPRVHLNIARALEGSEDFAKAEKAYKGVLAILPKDSQLRFEALFNMAGVQAKQKKIGEALQSYQAALEITPDSLEVKTNIELLWQGQGGGEGEGEDESKDDQKKEQQGKDPQQQQPKKQPKQFNSQELTPQDVKKILDEIKNQEQSIRAQENDKGAKEAPRDKDW